MIKKIISGGQTGVDQAALDAAIYCCLPYGGWLPAGRMTENGPLPESYKMEVLPSYSYPERTRRNVDEADVTLIISRGKLSGGSKLTERYALSKNKPCLHVDIDGNDMNQVLKKVEGWLHTHNPAVVNIAGPRASSDSAIYDEAYKLVVAILLKDLSAEDIPLQDNA